MAVGGHLEIDYRDVPSIAIPLGLLGGLAVHSHPQHQLTWVPEGVLTMEADDCRWVLQRSRALFIPGDTLHSQTAALPYALVSLYFDPDDCPLPWTRPTVVDATGIVGPLLDYIAKLPTGHAGERARAVSVLWDVLAPMSVTTLPTVLPQDPLAQRIALALKDNPADTRGIDEWGREVGSSARTLSRRFRAETGISFDRWRTLERLNASLPRLAAGEPISRVAREVGYQTPSAFVAAFKREIGTTPAMYFQAG